MTHYVIPVISVLMKTNMNQGFEIQEDGTVTSELPITPEQIHKDILQMVVDEILICREEGTATSRLTSLTMKITKYFKKL
jgi:hypothetical protein